MSIDLAADRNLVLTGFMGTGKTTVGRVVAERLQRRFVDMDSELERLFGKPVPAIFAEDGEPAFRVAEAQLCQQLAQEAGIVIATGGGALVNPHNRHALAASGVIVCLTASVDEIVGRLRSLDDRPLLAGDPGQARQRVRDLLRQRRHAYAAIAQQVDTTGLEPETIAERVLDAVRADAEAPGMTTVPVRHPGGAYDLCVGDGILSRAGHLLANRGLRPGPLAVVTNETVAGFHATVLLDSLRASGFEPHVCLIGEGEQHKTLATVTALYGQFADARLDRGSAVVGLGGGVVGDVAGFAAASWLRGVPFVQIPTTLLAMVDASVGGKTGVDLPEGKNLVGAFKQPDAVLMDTGTLETLPAAEFRSGLAEVVKHGIIGAPDLFEQLEEEGPTNLVHLVLDAVRVKVRVVEEDPYEKGRRAVLNLGHTFGHAIEQVSRYAVRHGDAVAVGMVAAARLAVTSGCCEPEFAGRIERLLERLGLPVRAPGYDADALLAAMGQDKKRAGRTLRFVVPRALGDVIVIDSPGDASVRDALGAILRPVE